MLTIVIPAVEYFNEATNEFFEEKAVTLQLEHSLVSLSKWESKWLKPFLSKKDKTVEETLDYVRCMTITQNVNPNVYKRITDDVMKQILDYIDSPMTATTFNNPDQTMSREVVTAEVIYYWMIAANVPFECQKWHLNKLLTLINVCNIKNAPQKKMGKKAATQSRKALNASRRKASGSRG